MAGGERAVIKRGRQLSTVAIDIVNDEGRLCSTGQVLYAMRTGADAWLY